MTDREIKDIQEWAENLQVEPEHHTWDRITQRLDGDELVVSVQRFKWIAVAASLVSVAAVLVTLQFGHRIPSDDLFAYNPSTGIRPVTFEKLDDSVSDVLYSRATIEGLRHAYAVHGFEPVFTPGRPQ